MLIASHRRTFHTPIFSHSCALQRAVCVFKTIPSLTISNAPRRGLSARISTFASGKAAAKASLKLFALLRYVPHELHRSILSENEAAAAAAAETALAFLAGAAAAAGTSAAGASAPADLRLGGMSARRFCPRPGFVMYSLNRINSDQFDCPSCMILVIRSMASDNSNFKYRSMRNKYDSHAEND